MLGNDLLAPLRDSIDLTQCAPRWTALWFLVA
jgi:hypothetical protein